MWNVLIGLINKWACMHQWEKLFERDKQVRSDFGGERNYTSITYCCKKCGKFKRWKSS